MQRSPPALCALAEIHYIKLWVYDRVFAALFGLYFLTVPADGISHLNRGDLLAFIAAGPYAIHIILVGDYTRRHSVAALSVLQVAACAALAWLGNRFDFGDGLAAGRSRVSRAHH